MKVNQTLFVMVMISMVLVAGMLGGSRVGAQDAVPVETKAPEEMLEATVVEIVEEKRVVPEYSQEEQWYQKLKVDVTKGSLKDKQIVIESGVLPVVNQQVYRVGDEIMVSVSQNVEDNDVFVITDYVRRGALGWLLVIFVVLTVVVGKWRGLMSLVGMGVSFAVVFVVILPKIAVGGEPIWAAILGSCVIIPITFYMSHGLNKKTTVAIAGTVIALVVTGVLAGVFVEAARLSGLATEEAGFLLVERQGGINIKGLLLAGMIIGVLGVLDDITISQSAIVMQLREMKQKMSFHEVYSRAMKVGQDHISSMVNTLVLVYAGASLPLLLLFIDSPRPLAEMMNYEMIATEVVRTLVGSIGLILAVPLTTAIAAWVGVGSGSLIKNERRER